MPITATVAPAAVIVASLRAIRRPATACLPLRWSSSTRRAASLSKRGCQPARRSAAQSTTHGYTT